MLLDIHLDKWILHAFHLALLSMNTRMCKLLTLHHMNFEHTDATELSTPYCSLRRMRVLTHMHHIYQSKPSILTVVRGWLHAKALRLSVPRCPECGTSHTKQLFPVRADGFRGFISRSLLLESSACVFVAHLAAGFRYGGPGVCHVSVAPVPAIPSLVNRRC